MGTTADKLSKLLETKAAIKDAIVAKGVDVADTDSFSSYVEKIGKIQSGSGSDNVIAQISAPMASPLVEGDKVWIEKNTGAAGAIYKHSGGVISAGSGTDYDTRIYKVGDVFTSSYTSSSWRTFYLAKYDKESQKFYYGGTCESTYFFYSLNNKQRLKGILHVSSNLQNRNGFYYNGTSFTNFASACRDIFTGGSKYYAASSSSDYVFCVDASATDPATQKNWCIVKLNLENGSFSQEVTASGYTTDIDVSSISTLFGTEDYCFVRGYTLSQQNSTVLKVDFINGTIEPYTFVGLGGTESIQLRYIYEDQFVITGDGLKYKITIDDSAKTITFTDGVVVENTPGVEIEQANDCENIFYGSRIYYWVDNPTDFDTISFKKIYTVTAGVAGENYQPPVFATDNKLFCAGVLLSENGGVVDTDAITEPLSQMCFISDGGYVYSDHNKVGKLGTGAFSYKTGGSLSNSALNIPMYWAYNGSLFFRGNLSSSPQYSYFYISNSTGTIDLSESYLFSLSGNNYDTNRLYGKYWGTMYSGSTIVVPTIRELNEDGTYTDFTVTRCPWSPVSSSYDCNIYWEGNDIYARVGKVGALKGTIDWENKTIDWGESMYLTSGTRVQSKQILFTTYDGLYNISSKGIYEYNTETCQYLLKSSWSSDITTILGGEPTQVQVLNNNYINLSRYTRTVLIRYDDSGIENAEIVATFDAEDYTGATIPTGSNIYPCWGYSYNREYLSFSYYNNSTLGGENICFKLGDSPYEYNAFKPSYTNLNSNWLTGKFTGTQGTDENGRRYVEVATVLPDKVK